MRIVRKLLNYAMSLFKLSKTGLSFKEKWYLSIPPAAVSLCSVLIHNVFIKYYTDIIGLNPKYIGWVYFIFNIWNAVNDPIIGVYVDKFRYREKRGKYLYIMRVTAPIMVLSTFSMVFSSPSWSDKLIFTILLIELFIYDTAQTFYSTAFGAYNLIAAPSMDDRIDISILRNYIANAISFVATLIPTLLLVGDKNKALIIPMFTLVVAVNGTIFWYAGKFLKEDRGMYAKMEDHQSPLSVKEVWKDSYQIIKTRAFLIYTIYVIIGRASMSYYFTPFLYFMDSVLRLNGAIATVVDVTSHTLVLLLMPLLGNLVKKWGGKTSVFVSMLPASIGYIGLMFINSAFSLTICYFLIILGLNYGATALGPLSAAMIDENEMITGVRKTGLFGGLNALFGTGFSGFANVIYASVISYFGYNGTLVHQTARTIFGLRLATGLIPLTLGLIGLIPFIFFPYNKEREREINEWSLSTRKSLHDLNLQSKNQSIGL